MELQGKETPIFNLGEVSVGMLIRVTLRLTHKFNTNIRLTGTYHIPNQWKFYKDFAKLFRFEIAALIEA